MESAFENFVLPREGINLSVNDYAKIICNMMDIPIYNVNTEKSVVEALHVLFSLYSEFKENKHFQNEEKIKNQNVMKFQ